VGEGVVGVPEEEEAVARVGRWDEGPAEQPRDGHHGEGEGDAERRREVDGEGGRVRHGGGFSLIQTSYVVEVDDGGRGRGRG